MRAILSIAVLSTSTLLSSACVPVDGKPGKDAVSSLVRLEPEPPGENCTYGGTRILAGDDANQNGVLEAAEVLDTSFVCSGAITGCTTLSGSLTIRNSLDWAMLIQAGCTAITGELRIDAPGLATLGAPAPLNSVGSLNVTGNPTLTGLSLPALASVTGDIHINENSALTGVSLPSLDQVGGSVEFMNNQALTQIAMPVLRLARDLRIVGSIALPGLALPALERLEGQFWLEGSPSMTVLSLPALAAVGDFSVVQNDALAVVALPALVSGTTLFSSCPALANLDLPVLATGGLAINGAALTSLALPALEQVISVSIDSCPRLSNLDFPILSNAANLNVIGNPALAVLGVPELVTVTGQMFVNQNGALTALALPSLTSGQEVTVRDNARLATLSLPVLGTAGTIGVGSNPELRSLAFPALTTGGAIQIDYLQLDTLELPVLATASVYVVVSSVSALTHLSLPALASTGTLHLSVNPALVGVSLPSLTSAGIYLGNNDLLGSFEAPVLASGSDITIYGNPQLATASFPILTATGNLVLSFNPALLTLGVPDLVTASYLSVTYNSVFPQCAAIALKDRLVTSCGLSNWTINDNDTAATCIDLQSDPAN